MTMLEELRRNGGILARKSKGVLIGTGIVVVVAIILIIVLSVVAGGEVGGVGGFFVGLILLMGGLALTFAVASVFLKYKASVIIGEGVEKTASAYEY